jgi:hypothetical protein
MLGEPNKMRDCSEIRQQYNDHRFRTPVDLRRSSTDVERVLVVGSCFSEGIARHVHRAIPGASSDHILFNFAGELPERPPRPVTDYAFQLVVLPLSTVMPETLFFGLKHDDLVGYNDALTHAEQRLLQLLEGALVYYTRHGLTAFVGNFLVPQQNSMGRLLPQNDARNPVWFVRQLNDLIAEYVARHANLYLLNIDEIAATIGRRHVQDDIIHLNSHGTFAFGAYHEFDQNRLHPPQPLDKCYDLCISEFMLALWGEADAMYRTLRQQDSVKIVICASTTRSGGASWQKRAPTTR